jgi:hypothetical protein
VIQREWKTGAVLWIPGLIAFLALAAFPDVRDPELRLSRCWLMQDATGTVLEE